MTLLSIYTKTPMLQLSKNQNLNTAALWINESSVSLTKVGFALTSSYSGQDTIVFGDIISSELGYSGGWLLVNISGSVLPSDSGLYDIKMYGADELGQATWGGYFFSWAASPATFGNVPATQITGSVLSEDLALISGSDYDSIVDYNYRDQAIFTVYNG